MQSDEIIRAVVDDSGMSMYAASLAMGRSKLYIAQAVYAKRIPTVRTLAALCDVTDHDLIVRNRKTGREITIDPPERESDED